MNKSIGHVCTVEKQTSGSFVPPLSKDAHCWERCIRAYKKFILVSAKDPLTQEYFRSTTGFLNERKRHALSKYSYIIHPFSDFAFYRELIMIFVFASTYVTAPLIATYTKEGICNEPGIYVLEFISTIIYCADIILKFFIAIDNKENKQVILEQNLIIRKYILSARFLLDISSAFSFCTLNQMVNLMEYRYLAVLRMLKIFRFFRFLKYFTHTLQRWNFSTIGIELMRYMLMTIVVVHWFSCFIHIVTLSHEESVNRHFFLGTGTISALYLASLFRTMGMLFCARSIWNTQCSIAEITVFIITYIFGNIFMLILTVCTLNQVLNEWSLELKYLKITNQLKEFMRYKKLPLNLRQRIKNYFEYKFRNKYFRENLITSILSDKLKHEINIQVCRKLIQHAPFLADLPTKVLGDLLTHLKSEVFLPNDIIIRAGTPGECMYFLSSGTVLITTPSGKEVRHLQDGAYFGEIALISKEAKRTANVIALEICETYRLDKKIFKMSIKKYPECLKIIQAVAEIRHQETNVLEEMYKEELFHKTFIGDNETMER